MKSKLNLILGFAVVLLGAICFLQSRQLNEHRKQVVVLKNDLAESEQKLQANEAALQYQQKVRTEDSELSSGLAAKVQELLKVKEDAARKLTSLQTTNASQAKPESGFSGMLSKMMEDPNMKKMMLEQQKLMMDKMYGPLFKDLKLSPEEISQFKAVLLEQQSKGMERGLAFFQTGKKFDPETAEAMASEQKEYDSKIKDLLGESRYAQYTEFKDSLAERMVLNQFRETGGDQALSDAQSEQLLQVMKEERKKIPARSESSPDKDVKDFQAMLSAEQMDKHFHDQEQMNQAVYERAKGILTPEQLSSFNSFQSNQLNLQRFGMEMARKMLGTEEAGKASQSK